MGLQITAYLPAEEAERFTRYALSLGLDNSSLANLLIVRELRLGRLQALIDHRRSEAVTARVKITAHAVRPEIKTAFQSAAAKGAVRTGTAAALVLLAELNEKWLEASLIRTTPYES